MWGKRGPKEHRNVERGLKKKKEKIHRNHFRVVLCMEKAGEREKIRCLR